MSEKRNGKDGSVNGLLHWILVHTLLWAVLYAAFGLQLDGALHLLKFYAWALSLISLTMLAEAAIRDSAKKPAQPIRSAFFWLQAWVMLALLVWFGHVATAAALAVAMLALAVHADKATKLRAAGGEA